MCVYYCYRIRYRSKIRDLWFPSDYWLESEEVGSFGDPLITIHDWHEKQQRRAERERASARVISVERRRVDEQLNLHRRADF